jgi:hypothetical protein
MNEGVKSQSTQAELVSLLYGLSGELEKYENLVSTTERGVIKLKDFREPSPELKGEAIPVKSDGLVSEFSERLRTLKRINDRLERTCYALLGLVGE